MVYYHPIIPHFRDQECESRQGQGLVLVLVQSGPGAQVATEFLILLDAGPAGRCLGALLRWAGERAETLTVLSWYEWSEPEGSAASLLCIVWFF